MTALQPIIVRYEGEGEFKPASPHWARVADKHYVIGEKYSMEAREERSMGHHRAYFAQINEAWHNIPESSVHRWPSPDHLRRYALIRAGFCDSSTFACGSHAEALRLASFLRPIDEFSIVEINGTTVTRFVAQSQDMRSMGRTKFRDSADKVLDEISRIIGVERAQLERSRAA